MLGEEGADGFGRCAIEAAAAGAFSDDDAANLAFCVVHWAAAQTAKRAFKVRGSTRFSPSEDGLFTSTATARNEAGTGDQTAGGFAGASLWIADMVAIAANTKVVGDVERDRGEAWRCIKQREVIRVRNGKVANREVAVRGDQKPDIIAPINDVAGRQPVAVRIDRECSANTVARCFYAYQNSLIEGGWRRQGRAFTLNRIRRRWRRILVWRNREYANDQRCERKQVEYPVWKVA